MESFLQIKSIWHMAKIKLSNESTSCLTWIS